MWACNILGGGISKKIPVGYLCIFNLLNISYNTIFHLMYIDWIQVGYQYIRHHHLTHIVQCKGTRLQQSPTALKLWNQTFQSPDSWPGHSSFGDTTLLVSEEMPELSFCLLIAFIQLRVPSNHKCQLIAREWNWIRKSLIFFMPLPHKD